MRTGSKVVLVVLALGAAGLIGVGLVGTVAGLLFYRGRVATEERMVLAEREAVAEHRARAEAARSARAETMEAETVASAAEPPAPSAPADARPLAERRQEALARGAEFLVKQQAADGSWGEGNVGITALCADALVAAGKTLNDPPVRKAVDHILKARKPDGGIYDDVGLKTYTTSISLMVLVETDPKAFADSIAKATQWLKDNQWDEGESIDRANPWYGGHGYGKHERPDLSNTQYFVEAMHRAGVPKDDPLWAKVVVFVSRSQDRSESNDRVFVGTDSGGMVYAPVGGGESKASTLDLPDGKKGLKAYGSMTYAGFKSFIYADLKRDDPRVAAAMDWIRRHWTFEENPELGQQGQYYYYQTAAKALKAWGEDKVLDGRRRSHDWRAELTEALLARQKADGSWTNEADRWYEGFAPVPTSYALIALAECR
jgi:squalene-hopene/tetraprenyl-beta-curcumene cyclase